MDHHLHHGDMAARRPPLSSAALRSVQKPPAKPWRAVGAGLPAPVPPRVYRVEPREFRDLVQRLTGAAAPPHHLVQTAQPVPVEEMYGAAPWSSFPLPVDAHHGI